MYLSKILIKNFRGINQLTVIFNPKLNVIIGENGCHKSALIDAIRLLYNIGEQQRNIYVSNDDFYIDPTTKIRATKIELSYEFSELNDDQKGAYNALLVCSNADPAFDCLKVNLIYEFRIGRYPSFSYFTGAEPGQKADIKNFELFQHYYLSPLRNSTRDLMTSKGSVLSELIMRQVYCNNSQQQLEDIVERANTDLLGQNEVINTRTNINNNLDNIFYNNSESKIGLQIEKSKIDNVVNLIKPYLPFDAVRLDGDGFSLDQNSLGYNNLIYIATILGDINQRTLSDQHNHFALLIEEPEVHLHPQLQLSLFNFLNETNTSNNSQLFITSHSPTLTSKVPLENLILLDVKAFPINECFLHREGEGIIQDTSNMVPLSQADFQIKKKQLERYIDVTRSQLFFAKGVLFVEGIAEEILLPALCQVLGFKVEDFRLEIVNVDGISFYPFLCLFNSDDEIKRLSKRVSILTDDDRYTDSKDKKYSFSKLIENDYKLVDELYSLIASAPPSNRIRNLFTFSNKNPNILLQSAWKTFEFEIALSNVPTKISEIEKNFFVDYTRQVDGDNFLKIKDYYSSLKNNLLSYEERNKIALLFWKSMPTKAEFAQDFAIYITEHLLEAKQNFIVPQYIINALEHLTKG
jgi:putative ATP-dependent endonuclease of OLD family